MSDWRDALLKRFSFPAYERIGRNPIAWPGYSPSEVVRFGIGDIGGHKVVAAVWDFSRYGGSFGELDAGAFAEAAARAARYGEPLVSFVRSGGMRLQEGMAALVGMPRAQLALRRLADAGVPHLAVADQPTTGGVFISVVTRADLRVAVSGATVGFAGPRVVEIVAGAAPPEGSHTAESAYAAGLVDAVVSPDDAGEWLTRALAALATGSPGTPSAGGDPARTQMPDHEGDDQVALARHPERPAGADVLAAVLPDGVALRAPRGDESVAAATGHLTNGVPAVVVALAAARRGRPTPDGYLLAQRAARLAARLDRVLVTLVDTPSAEPGPDAEAGGIAAAIGDTLDALLGCAAPTLAVVTGEGGSGGAIAASVADRVLVTPGSYFAVLGPEAAAAALRADAGATARRLRLRPPDLLALGFADALTREPGDPAFAGEVASAAASLAALDPAERRAERERRWASQLPGRLA